MMATVLPAPANRAPGRSRLARPDDDGVECRHDAPLFRRFAASLAASAPAQCLLPMTADHVVISSWRLRPILVRDHVGGIPTRPVVLGSCPVGFFVLAMMCSRSLATSSVSALATVNSGVRSPRQSGCELLEQPAVAVRIMERGNEE